ncbi:hypothetical protein HJG40_14505, partial [Acidithiobacillus sp. ATCC 19703]|nr:hypothetical protein [Acidithiobacillus concretivorus]
MKSLKKTPMSRKMRSLALMAGVGMAGFMIAAPAYAWGPMPWSGGGGGMPWSGGGMPWSGYSGPMNGNSGPFSGYGGPMQGSEGPWDAGGMNFNGPHGGPMNMNSGNYGGYGQPYQGEYQGGG